MASGDPVYASTLPTSLQTATITANTAVATTTEISVLTATAGITAGRVYRIWALVRGGSTVVNDTVLVRIREDSVTGTELAVGRIQAYDLDGAACGPLYLVAQYTALATISKTFAVCITRRTGTGNVSLRASTTAPGMLVIDALAS